MLWLFKRRVAIYVPAQRAVLLRLPPCAPRPCLQRLSALLAPWIEAQLWGCAMAPASNPVIKSLVGKTLLFQQPLFLKQGCDLVDHINIVGSGNGHRMWHRDYLCYLPCYFSMDSSCTALDWLQWYSQSSQLGVSGWKNQIVKTYLCIVNPTLDMQFPFCKISAVTFYMYVLEILLQSRAHPSKWN